MAKTLQNCSVRDPRQTSSRAEQAYQDWVQAYLEANDGFYTDGSFAVYESALKDLTFRFFRAATRMTLHPDTSARMWRVRPYFDSDSDAILHDWFEVGRDLYMAIQKSRIALPCAGASEPEPATSVR